MNSTYVVLAAFSRVQYFEKLLLRTRKGTRRYLVHSRCSKYVFMRTYLSSDCSSILIFIILPICDYIFSLKICFFYVVRHLSINHLKETKLGMSLKSIYISSPFSDAYNYETGYVSWYMGNVMYEEASCFCAFVR